MTSRSVKLNRGREVIRGRLWFPKGKSGKKQRAEVVVYCATHDCSHPGQLEIFEESHKNYQKPKKIVPLTTIKTEGGLKEGPSISHVSSSPASHSFLSSSPSSTPLPQTLLYSFNLILINNDVIEFYTESVEDQRQWMKRIGMLLMFPYSPVPEEPTHNPIKEGFRKRLNPRDYNADSVWAVYILPEEVGTRIHALGVHIIALRSKSTKGSNPHPGQLDIISPTDPTSPVVTWERDKMRRTGCLGNMVFIEIGRRCRGGAGLVWMYASSVDSAGLRETLHSFLFKGDGHAVAIPARAHSDPGYPRASVDSSLPPSYARRASSDGSYQTQTINTPRRQLSVESQDNSDSGHPPSPLSTSTPPPVDLNSHPSRRKPSFRRASAPQEIRRRSQYENTDIDSGVGDSRHDSVQSGSVDSSNGDIFSMDNDIGIGSYEDNDGLGQRHSTIPSSQALRNKFVTHRSNSTGTCHPSLRTQEYVEMMHPRANLARQDYVMMQPAPVQVDSMSPRSLSPIKETTTKGRDRDDYMNFPLPYDVANQKQVVYQTPYENVVLDHENYTVSGDDNSPSCRSYLGNRRQSKEDVLLLGGGRSSLSGHDKSVSPQPHIRFVQGTQELIRDDRSTDSPSPVIIESVS